MTLLSQLDYRPQPAPPVAVPRHIRADQISVIIPVQDHQAGIDRLVARFVALSVNCVLPAEIIVVDHGAAVPRRLGLPPQTNGPHACPLRHVTCDRPGPAAARNAGAAVARGDWLLFMDSACLPTATRVSGYLTLDNRYVAYAGRVDIPPTSILARYYATEELLCPPAVPYGARTGPAYLVTANCLVATAAFQAVGGFDEHFAQAGGEGIDLAFRLRRVGALGANDRSQVLHPISDGLRGFWRRFRRYGQGQRQLAAKYHLDLAPRPFWPRERRPVPVALALLQVVALWVGYRPPPGAASAPAGEPSAPAAEPAVPADVPRAAGGAGRGAAEAPSVAEQHLARATHQLAQGASLLTISRYLARTLAPAQIEHLQQAARPPTLAHALALARAERQFADLRQQQAQRRAALQAQVPRRRAAGTLVAWLATLAPAERRGLGTAAERRAARALGAHRAPVPAARPPDHAAR